MALSCFVVLKSQDPGLSDSISVPPGSSITTDNLGNLFVITPTNDIVKYDKNGRKMATANFKVLGKVTSLDAANPFDIYVFYRDQNKVVFLDNMLNLLGEIDLEMIGVSQVPCIGRSGDNQLWLFDMADLKLKKYSKNLRLVTESASFNTLTIGPDILPSMIVDVNTSVFMLNQGKILEFDVFANFSKIKLIDTLQTFQCVKLMDSLQRLEFVKEKIIYLKGNQVYVFNTLDFTVKKSDLALPPNTRGIRIEKERLYVLTDEYVILQTFSEK